MQYLKDNVRERILAAAREEFTEHGYAVASIRNIACAAGLSIGNIYRYYPGKRELFLAVVLPLVDSVKERVRATTHSDPLRRIEMTVDAVIAEKDILSVLYKNLISNEFDLCEVVFEAIVELTESSFVRDDDLIKALCAGLLSSLSVILNQSLSSDKLRESIINVASFYFLGFKRL